MTRVGLYLDLRIPPGTRGADVYARTLDRVADAERRGLEAAWVTEHHGFADGYLPAPLTATAAIAARTRTLRVGTAVVIGPMLPAETLAEQAAVVDLISGGRLELGVGAGWSAAEFARVGADHRARYTTLEDQLRRLPGLWADGTVTPAPVQDPLPTWVGARGPRGARLAGRVGAGLLWLDPALVDPYLEGLGGREGRLGGLVNVLLADDPDAAKEEVRAAARRNRASYSGNDDAAATKGDTTFPRLRVLTADDAVAAIREQLAPLAARLPVTDVFCFADLGGLPADVVDRHLELVTDVLRPGLELAPVGGAP
ncbi:alkanesulfonate monooxygenase SsuD/methylene tetrahydromethanopterin reductase-like flavin-dependent oxidoreductase (luciferase family) [Actinomycetospora succinea]|uniref:Alkanesulfonate monooxygenase SsuD/methylene tetrahydromethanopterin reductase-like flavin-dependent oxidoreductase (Luciferase family) n=1 Tax=Actinomycetospora succinea TaxID=663603 RepID=A0A4R6VRI9_9PSEU|nr:LLM class flavin-dependent oxidoreductase [Actinomycetospora succinea]TDQ62460.1 alkanesulfonate monooxygenase SsuD/methylene tetrahydromethanopterin reductase-like flavin-dependent oxidoreductase (luciferase family) [Actinomycetospora succinea]